MDVRARTGMSSCLLDRHLKGHFCGFDDDTRFEVHDVGALDKHSLGERFVFAHVFKRAEQHIARPAGGIETLASPRAHSLIVWRSWSLPARGHA